MDASTINMGVLLAFPHVFTINVHLVKPLKNFQNFDPPNKKSFFLKFSQHLH
jgi:hypothetical protein